MAGLEDLKLDIFDAKFQNSPLHVLGDDFSQIFDDDLVVS